MTYPWWLFASVVPMFFGCSGRSGVLDNEDATFRTQAHDSASAEESSNIDASAGSALGTNSRVTDAPVPMQQKVEVSTGRVVLAVDGKAVPLDLWQGLLRVSATQGGADRANFHVTGQSAAASFGIALSVVAADGRVQAPGEYVLNTAGSENGILLTTGSVTYASIAGTVNLNTYSLGKAEGKFSATLQADNGSEIVRVAGTFSGLIGFICLDAVTFMSNSGAVLLNDAGQSDTATRSDSALRPCTRYTH